MKNPNIRKIEEFEAFLKYLEEGTAAHWVQVAEALGVDKDTITEWRKHPKAQKAIKDGIKYAMEQMETAGKRDWRMWEVKLKLLDVQAVDRADITSAGERIVGPVIYKPKKHE